MPAQTAPRRCASSSAKPLPQATSSSRSTFVDAQLVVNHHVLPAAVWLGQRRQVGCPPAPSFVHDSPRRPWRNALPHPNCPPRRDFPRKAIDWRRSYPPCVRCARRHPSSSAGLPVSRDGDARGGGGRCLLSLLSADSGVNGHWEIRLGGLVFSGLAATSFPGWWPRVLPAGRGQVTSGITPLPVRASASRCESPLVRTRWAWWSSRKRAGSQDPGAGSPGTRAR
jgi:hypothetical protein